MCAELTAISPWYPSLLSLLENSNPMTRGQRPWSQEHCTESCQVLQTGIWDVKQTTDPLVQHPQDVLRDQELDSNQEQRMWVPGPECDGRHSWRGQQTQGLAAAADRTTGLSDWETRCNWSHSAANLFFSDYFITRILRTGDRSVSVLQQVCRQHELWIDVQK